MRKNVDLYFSIQELHGLHAALVQDGYINITEHKGNIRPIKHPFHKETIMNHPLVRHTFKQEIHLETEKHRL